MIMSQMIKYGDLAKEDLTRACTGLETATNALASTPYYVATAINKNTALAIMEAENAAIKSIQFTLNLIKNLLLYIMFRYQRVLQCLVTMTATASLSFISQNAQQITDLVNKEMSDIANALTTGLAGLTSQLRSINDATSKLNVNILGVQTPNIPQIPLPLQIPGLTDRQKFRLPEGTAGVLSGLGSTPSSLNQIQAGLADLIAKPFDDLQTKIDGDIRNALLSSNLKNASDFNMLPVPKIVDSIKFCGAIMPTRGVDMIVEGSIVTLWASLIILCIIGVGALFMEAYSIYVVHQYTKKDLAYVENNFLTGNDYLTDRARTKEIDWVLRYPIIRRIVNRFGGRGSFSGGALARFAWFLTYTSNPLAWFCLITGVMGLLLVQLQLVLIPFVVKALLPYLMEEVDKTAINIATDVQRALDGSIGPYLLAMNGELDKIESGINAILFGWVATTLSTIDSGITQILTSFKTEMSKAFGGFAPLESVVTNFFTCVVGNVTFELQRIQVLLQNQTGIHLIRVSADQFSIDASQLVDRVQLQSSVQMLKASSATNQAQQVFLNQFNILLGKYVEFIKFQSIPFIILILFGGSLLAFGLIFVAMDIIKARSRKSV